MGGWRACALTQTLYLTCALWIQKQLHTDAQGDGGLVDPVSQAGTLHLAAVV